MGRLSFRNTREVVEVKNTEWWRVRYYIEIKIAGFELNQNISCVLVGFLKDDFSQSIPLHDNYLIKENDDIVVIRLPLLKPVTFTEPPQIFYENNQKHEFAKLSKYIKEESDECKRLKLIQEQQKLNQSDAVCTKFVHPSLQQIQKRYTHWRLNNDEKEGVRLIRAPLPGPQYICYKCLNFIKPLHYMEDCRAPVTHKSEWLVNKKMPHGVIKTTIEPVSIQNPADILSVEWIDAKGVLWKSKQRDTTVF